MLFLSEITILHIFDRFKDYTFKKKKKKKKKKLLHKTSQTLAQCCRLKKSNFLENGLTDLDG